MAPSLFLAALVVACSGEQAGGGGSGGGSGGGAAAELTITDAHRTEAKGLFESLCVSCHGATGAGDGPAAAAMDPKPRAFGDPTWQTSVTDDHIRKVITLGGAAVGKSAAMVAQPQLKSKPEVLEAIVQIVRGFGKK
jgi:mono/diheme cytochrome c family protein